MTLNRWILAVLVGIFFSGALTAGAQTATQSNGRITTWWPDVRQGLLWTGTTVGGGSAHENYDKAVQDCNSLVLDGMAGWRLPVIAELDGNMVSGSFEVTTQDHHGEFHDTGQQVTQGFLAFAEPNDTTLYWSSTPGPKGKIVMEAPIGQRHFNSKPSDHLMRGAFCVRALPEEIASVARQVMPVHGVATLQDLRNLIPLRQAFDAYTRKDYTASVAAAQNAIALNPKSAEAFYAVALDQAALGKWSDAITAFERVKKIQWGSVGGAISWAKENEKAAASGKTLDAKKNVTPDWTFGAEPTT